MQLDSATLTMVKNLAAKTGRSLDEWIALLATTGLAKHGEMVNWLKTKHGLGHGYANLVVTFAKERAAPGPATADAQLDAIFAGDKAAHRPLYDSVLAELKKLGDFEVAPKKAYVSLRRSKQFACFHPSTKDRADLCLVLKGVPPAGRLEASGSFNAMATHRVRLEKATDFDAEVRRWLKQAHGAA
jgi:hypothetical protein